MLPLWDNETICTASHLISFPCEESKWSTDVQNVKVTLSLVDWAMQGESTCSLSLHSLQTEQVRADVHLPVHACCHAWNVATQTQTHTVTLTCHTDSTCARRRTCAHCVPRAAVLRGWRYPQEKLTCLHSNNTERDKAQAVVVAPLCEGGNSKTGYEKPLGITSGCVLQTSS